MPSLAVEWLDLVLRWIHVIAAIMWIGDSFLFMWLDSSLARPTRTREGEVVGELWMVHSGGFYEVVKRRFLARHQLPETLHWFKWQAYTTWISGFFLLGVVYYLGGGVYLVDRSAPGLGLGAAIALSLALLAAGWLAYDALWSGAAARRPVVAGLVSLALLAATSFALTRIYTGRAAYVHVGAILGTIMAANVWRRIVPAQAQMLAATRAGRPVDTTLGERAKLRSIHNHYLTLPVVFAMLSSHFPSTYGHPLNWLVLLLLMAAGAAVKHVMSHRRASNRWTVVAGSAALVAVIALTARPAERGAAAAGYAEAAPVPFAEVSAILERRCLSCHAARPANPSFPEPAGGIVFEDPRRIQSLAERIRVRTVLTETMPLGNLTGMTREERHALGAWIAQGARIDDRPDGPGSASPP